MFARPDPFSGADALTLKQEEIDRQPAVPVTQPTTPVLEFAKLPLAPRVIETQNTTADIVVGPSKFASNRDSGKSLCISNVSRRAGGWFVAYHAILPGVYSSW